VVCAVPWARHGSRFTRAFEDQAAWLAVNTSKAAVAELLRIASRAVGGICAPVCTEPQREVDLLDGLRSVVIDEISPRKGQRYLTSSSIKTPTGWFGRLPAMTAGPSRRSPTSSAKSAATVRIGVM
jgi:hypothetical protein